MIYQVPSIVLTSFRQDNFTTPTPIAKQTPNKPTQIRDKYLLKGAVMQNEKALITDHLRVSKVS